jgi:predicted transcriptional regulator
MAVLEWHLRAILDRHEITPYKFAKAMNISPKNVYRWTNHTPSQIEFNTVTEMLTVLRAMTGIEFQVSDLLEYTEN